MSATSDDKYSKKPKFQKNLRESGVEAVKTKSYSLNYKI